MTALKWLWASTHYWPLYLAAALVAFGIREGWALSTGRAKDTLSDWTWAQLHIMPKETIGQWTASDLLVFCAYITVFVIWLPWHFFFRRFG